MARMNPRATRRGAQVRWWPLLLAASLGLGCGNSAAEAPVPPPSAPATPAVVTSHDGVLSVSVSPAYVVHRVARGVMITAHDGDLRIYFRHEPDDKLIRVTGTMKEDLDHRGWTLDAERHYERATELRMSRHARSHTLSRALWVASRDGRVLVCDALAHPSQVGQLDGLQALCGAVALKSSHDVAPPTGPEAPPSTPR